MNNLSKVSESQQKVHFYYQRRNKMKKRSWCKSHADHSHKHAQYKRADYGLRF